MEFNKDLLLGKEIEMELEDGKRKAVIINIEDNPDGTNNIIFAYKEELENEENR